MGQHVAPSGIQIRPARRDDAEVAAVLLYSAYAHTRLSYPPRAQPEGGFIEHLRDYFRQDGNRFSYQQALVADAGSSGVVGLVLSFGGRDEPRLNAAVGVWLEREAQPDEWYVDALAVLADRERQGIGTALMAAAERQARMEHYSKVALNVAEGNDPAMSLYTRLGYVTTGQTILYQRPHIRMVKTLTLGGTDAE